VILDTTVLIDHLRDDPAANAWLQQLPAVPLCSEVSRTEVIRGLRSHERSKAERLFLALKWAPLDEAIARIAGDLGRQYRRSHALSTIDLIVAATAIHHGDDVATANVKHFPMFPRLRPPY
jgi:hypothetical protein